MPASKDTNKDFYKKISINVSSPLANEANL